MKLLLDSCVWGGARDIIAAAGHDVVVVPEWGADPGDAEVLRRAHEEGRVLVTLDKDFGELVIVRGLLHSGLVRLVGLRAREQGVAVVEVCRNYEADLAAAAIVTVYRDRVRVRTVGS